VVWFFKRRAFVQMQVAKKKPKNSFCGFLLKKNRIYFQMWKTLPHFFNKKLNEAMIY
jgi:hypothetical protein